MRILILAVLGLPLLTVSLAAGERPAPPVQDLSGLPRHPVRRVVDGDTIRVELDGQSESVRVIGLDTPETVHPSKPVEYYGKEASARAGELLADQLVCLIPDQGEELQRDRYGRILAHVWREDGLCFAFEMIADGYAQDYPKYPFREDYMELFAEAEAFARDNGLGLWGEQPR
ncbi:thermonuclease family protein [bacterium]|nr:thermonuclease family protein [bacterium]